MPKAPPEPVTSAMEIPLYRLCKDDDENAHEYLGRFIAENALVELPEFPEQDVPEGYDAARPGATRLSVGQFRVYLQTKYTITFRLYHLPPKQQRQVPRVVMIAKGMGCFWYADVTEFLRELKDTSGTPAGEAAPG